MTIQKNLPQHLHHLSEAIEVILPQARDIHVFPSSSPAITSKTKRPRPSREDLSFPTFDNHTVGSLSPLHDLHSFNNFYPHPWLRYHPKNLPARLDIKQHTEVT